MSFPTVRAGVRPLGLTKRSKSTPSSSNALSLEDETQQPLVEKSSQGPAPSSSGAILLKFEEHYNKTPASASSGPSGVPTPRLPPSSDPPLAATSDLTQEAESDGSIAWESNPAPLPIHASDAGGVLGQIDEEPASSQPPPTASGKSSELTDLPSATPDCQQSQRDDIDSAESEMSDVEEGGDGSDVSTPSNSDPDIASAPARGASMRSPAAPLRPITQSAPGTITSPSRQYIFPSRHASTLATPTKRAKLPAFSPTRLTAPKAIAFPRPSSPSKVTSPSKWATLSSAPALPRTLGHTRSAPSRSPSPGQSSDFAHDMVPGPSRNPRERFDATMRMPSTSPSKSLGPGRSSPEPRRDTIPHERESDGFVDEPTFLNDDGDGQDMVMNEGEPGERLDDEEQDELDPRDPEDEDSGRGRRLPPGQAVPNSSDTQVDPTNSGIASTPASRPPPPLAMGSQTQINTYAAQGSQTQLNSDIPLPSSPVARGHFASLNARSIAVLSSPDLLGETMGDDDIGAPREMSPLQESFVATQVKSLPPATSSPFKQPLPAFPSSPLNRIERARMHPITISGASSGKEGAAPPSDAEFEPTYVEARSGGLADEVPVPSSDPPPLRIFPSSIERPILPRRTVASVPVIPTPPSPRLSEQRMLAVREAETTPTKRPLREQSSEESERSLFRPKPKPLSPRKYGKRHNRTSHIPSTRAGMPHQPPASADGSPTEKATSSVGDPEGMSQRESLGAPPAESIGSTRSPAASSGATPEDPEDETFRDPGGHAVSSETEASETEMAETEPTPAVELQPSVRPRKPKGKGKAKAKTTPALRERATSRATSRPVRDKRKARSTSPEFSDSSSSAPEDEEDFSYRPTEPGRAKAKLPATTERVRKASASSRDVTPDGPSKSKGKRAAATSPQPKSAKRARKATATPASRSARTGRTSRGREATATTAASTSVPPQLQPLRVLAEWHEHRDYYAATVTEGDARGFHVQFDDGHDAWVERERMRLLKLQPDEPVCERSPGNMCKVAEEYNGLGDVCVVDAHNRVRRIPSKHLVVLGLDIVRRFADRRIPAEELEGRFPESIGAFAGKAFIVTGDEGKDAVARKILQNGGVVANDWSDLFNITNDGHTINASRGAPFLVSVNPGKTVSSKLMSSLAAGVPVVSPRYIEDGSNGSVDWRAYLISPGVSALLQSPAVQVVDPAWGSPSWEATEAQAVRQPLAGTSVLWVPARSSWKPHNEINTIVPFCLRATGARMTVTASLPPDLSSVTQDIVMVEDRDGRNLTKAQRTSGKLVNVGWLKAVLMAGARLPPSMTRN